MSEADTLSGSERVLVVRGGSAVPTTTGAIAALAEAGGGLAEADLPAALAALGLSISSPLDIDGCVLWLDASDATTINAGSPVDDDPVSTWADKSTSGFDATQATADNRPVYKTNIQNGKAVVRFDPATFPQHLALSGAGLDLFRNLSGCTIATVVRPLLTTCPVISAGIVVGANPILEHFAHRQDLFQAMYDTSFSDSFGPSMNRLDPISNGGNRTAYAGVMSADMITTSFGAITTLFNNSGTPENSATVPHTADVSATAIVIGGDYTTLVATDDADYCEIVVFDRALNANQTRLLYEFLVEKWGTL